MPIGSDRALKSYVMMPGIFALGFAVSSLLPSLRRDAGGISAPTITLADLARPEVFVPVFLVAFVILSIIALRDNEASKGKGRRAASQNAGGSTERPEGGDAAQVSNERQALARTRDEVEQQLNSIFSLVGDYITTNGSYSASLDTANSRLDVADSLDQVREVIAFLVRENSVAVKEARQLRYNLESATQRIADMRERLKEATLLATVDSLTGVATRRSFDSFLQTAVRRSHADQTPLCLILADIDHFKRINDTHGHQAGDEVLREFSRLLASGVRSSDLVARYGGEEFSIVLPKTTAGSALAIVERLMKQLSNVTFRANGVPVAKVTASFGIAAVQPNETPEELIARADKKVYEAKVKGRNRVEIDTLSSA